MINAVKITRAESQRRYPHRKGFRRYSDNVRQVSLSIADEVQSLRAGVLRAVASNRPLAGNAGVQVGKGPGPGLVLLQERRESGDSNIVQKNLGFVDFLPSQWMARDDDVRSHDVPMPQRGRKAGILTYKRIKRLKMSVLDEVGYPGLCGEILPPAGTEVFDCGKRASDKLAGEFLEQIARSLP